MKKGGGASKGSSFERELCKQFSLWISEGERDDVFWRTAGSGARATTRAKNGKCTANSEGDMCCLDEKVGGWFLDNFYFEFKRGYNSWRVDDFLLKEKFELKTVWEKCVQAAGRKKIPILILKQDRRDPLLFSYDFQFFATTHYITFNSAFLRIFKLDFSKLVDPKNIKKIVEEYCKK